MMLCLIDTELNEENPVNKVKIEKKEGMKDIQNMLVDRESKIVVLRSSNGSIAVVNFEGKSQKDIH